MAGTGTMRIARARRKISRERMAIEFGTVEEISNGNLHVFRHSFCVGSCLLIDGGQGSLPRRRHMSWNNELRRRLSTSLKGLVKGISPFPFDC